VVHVLVDDVMRARVTSSILMRPGGWRVSLRRAKSVPAQCTKHFVPAQPSTHHRRPPCPIAPCNVTSCRPQTP